MAIPSVSQTKFGFVWQEEQGEPLEVERNIEDHGLMVVTLRRGKYNHEVYISPKGVKAKLVSMRRPHDPQRD